MKTIKTILPITWYETTWAKLPVFDQNRDLNYIQLNYDLTVLQRPSLLQLISLDAAVCKFAHLRASVRDALLIRSFPEGA